MKTVVYPGEGIELSSSRNRFGNAKESGNISHFMMRVEHDTCVHEFELVFHYRITDDGYIQLIEFAEGEKSFISGQYKLQGNSLKEELTSLLKEYCAGTNFWIGYPKLLDSVFVTEEEFDSIILGLKNAKVENRRIAQKKRTQLIDYMGLMGFEPVPYGWDTFMWHAKCPGHDFNHMVDVSTQSDTWGCGFCKQSGNYNDFIRWVDQLYLAKYNKELNSDAGVPEYLQRWWKKRNLS